MTQQLNTTTPRTYPESLRDTLLQHSAHAMLAAQDAATTQPAEAAPATAATPDDTYDDAVPSLQKLLSLRQQQQQQRLSAPNSQFPPLTLPSSKRSRPSPDAVLPPVIAASPCGSQVASSVSSSSPASSGHSSPTIAPVAGTAAARNTPATTPAAAATVLPSIPRFAVTPQDCNNSSTSSANTNAGCGARGNGQMAMIYSPSLEGNVPVKALPLAQLTVSTQKIFKFRTFSVFLELNSAYVRKQRLTPEDILKAGLSAKCCKENAPGIDIFCCQVCNPKKRVIDLSVSNQQVFGPRKTDYGTEIYTFDTCKTNCSSSRDHHKSNICVVIDSLPGAGTIISPPLVLQAREKQQSLSKSKGFAVSRDHTLASAAPVLPALSANSHPQALPSSSSSSYGPAALPSIVSEPASSAPSFSQFLPRTTLSSTTTTTTPSAQSAAAWAPVFSAAVAQSSALDVKVKVTLMSSMLPAADIERSVQHFKTYLQQLPGFVQFKYSILPGFFVAFTFFDTEEHHNAASVLLKNYLQNTNGVTNIFNENLVSSGAVVVLAACTSW